MEEKGKKAVWTQFQHCEEIIQEALERMDHRGRTTPIKGVRK